MSPDAFWPQRFKQIAVMVDAGLSVETAMRTIAKNESQSPQALARVIGLVQRGVSLADALQRSNCINATDFRALKVAEQAGRLASGLNYIAERRSAWLQRVESFKGTLLMPKMVLLIGAVAGLFIRTSSGGQSMASAVFDVGLVFVAALAFMQLSVRLLKLDSLHWLSLGWRVPSVRRSVSVFQLAFEQHFYRLFIWQLASGISSDQSVAACQLMLTAPSFKRSVRSAANDINAGKSIRESLTGNDLVLTTRLRQVLAIASETGRWEHAIEHDLGLQRVVLDQKAANFFSWLPKVYYLLTLLTISKFIFS